MPTMEHGKRRRIKPFRVLVSLELRIGTIVIESLQKKKMCYIYFCVFFLFLHSSTPCLLLLFLLLLFPLLPLLLLPSQPYTVHL